jgi:hypothetical protein
MSQLNPLTGSVVQAPQVQRNLAADKSRQMRQAQELRRGGAAQDEQEQPQVASAEELDPISDHPDDHPPRRQPRSPHQDNPTDGSDGGEGLDLKA